MGSHIAPVIFSYVTTPPGGFSAVVSEIQG